MQLAILLRLSLFHVLCVNNKIAKNIANRYLAGWSQPAIFLTLIVASPHFCFKSCTGLCLKTSGEYNTLVCFHFNYR